MNLEFLTNLKKKLAFSEDFRDTMNYFMDWFESPANRSGEQEGLQEESLVQTALRAAVQNRLQNAKAEIALLEEKSFPEHNYSYGVIQVTRGAPPVSLGVFFYFHDLRKGMVSFTMGTKGITHFTRFTASVAIDRGGLPSFGPPDRHIN
jgi:hypothetical protein